MKENNNNKYMHTTLTIPLFLLSFTALMGQWGASLTLPHPRTEMKAVYGGNKVFFAGGLTAENDLSTASPVIDIYDLSTGQWSSYTAAASLYETAAVVLGDKVLFAGGKTTNWGEVNTMEVYDISTGTWSQVTMPNSRRDMEVAVIGEKAWFGGGFQNGSAATDILVYDGPTGTWSTIPFPGLARRDMGVAAAGPVLVCAAGKSDFNLPSNRIDLYNTETGTWTYKILPEEHHDMKALSSGNKAIITGGYAGFSPGNKLFMYDYSTDSLAAVNYSPNLSGVGVNIAVAIHNGLLMVSGGGTISASAKIVVMYHIASGQWIPFSFSHAFPGGQFHYKQAGVSTPAGFFIGGGQTNFVDVIEDKVFVFDFTVPTVQSPSLPLSIHPTLATASITVSLPEQEDNTALRMEIRDMTGQLYQADWQPDGEQSWTITTGHLPAGMYVVQVKGKQQVFSGQFVRI